MMNFWKQSNHVMSYFNTENFRGADRLPNNFMKGFLEVRPHLRFSACSAPGMRHRLTSLQGRN